MPKTLAAKLALALFAATVSMGTASEANAQRLTASERGALDRGELVTRSTEERRGSLHLFGGTSWQVLDLTPEQAWRAVKDKRLLRYMLPQVAASRVVTETATSATIEFSHRYGPISATYRLRFRYDEENHLVTFQLDEAHAGPLRAAWGFFKVRPHGDHSLISFGAKVDIGSGLAISALRPTIHEWVLKIPLTMKWYVEGRGRRFFTR